MYFVKIETFIEMEYFYKPNFIEKLAGTVNEHLESFVGFDSSVQFFHDLNCSERWQYFQNQISRSVESFKTYSSKHNNCYSIVPVCIVTEGITGINCFREDKKTLYLYDLMRNNLFNQEIDSLTDLEFYKIMNSIDAETIADIIKHSTKADKP